MYIREVKLIIAKDLKMDVSRISLKNGLTAKALADDIQLVQACSETSAILYIKDLGPQIGWKTVFFLEYFGPLLIYLGIYFVMKGTLEPTESASYLALVCWEFHYAKRIIETLVIHRFSHGTMPITNLFRNCAYYWGFTAMIAFSVSHPQFSEPSMFKFQVFIGLSIFLFGEIGNLCCHLALRDLRPAGSRQRKIPYPVTHYPPTFLFDYVACPNYTYEFISWIGFSIMTQCFYSVAFTMCGFYMMTVWALGKLRAYRKEFYNFPKNRKAIIPFLL